jgi:hypothetical protein
MAIIDGMGREDPRIWVPFSEHTESRPALGADTDRVLTEVLELPPERIAALRAGGAFG